MGGRGAGRRGGCRDAGQDVVAAGGVVVDGLAALRAEEVVAVAAEGISAIILTQLAVPRHAPRHFPTGSSSNVPRSPPKPPRIPIARHRQTLPHCGSAHDRRRSARGRKLMFQQGGAGKERAEERRSRLTSQSSVAIFKRFSFNDWNGPASG